MGKLFVGIDGGGTKTECVVCAEDGRVLGRAISGPSNPNGQSLAEACANLRRGAEQALQGAPEGEIHLFAGVAGCAAQERKEIMEAALWQLLPKARSIRCESDTVIGLSCGVGAGKDGVIAVSGTGSSCFARIGGQMRRVGGWGYLFEDLGSGYEIGRMALMAGMREKDGRGEHTLLTRLCEEKLGCAIEEAIPALYEGGRTFIASFAPCVSEALGDPAAAAILEKNAWGMAEQIHAALRHFAGEETVSVVLSGSLWEHIPTYRARVQQLSPARCRFVIPERPPVYGAVLEAAFGAEQKYMRKNNKAPNNHRK